MPTRYAVGAALILLSTACTSPPVVDLKLLPCPRERITEPACVEPPPPGTKRDQGDVFANERGCWSRVVAWDSGHLACTDAKTGLK